MQKHRILTKNDFRVIEVTYLPAYSAVMHEEEKIIAVSDKCENIYRFAFSGGVNEESVKCAIEIALNRVQRFIETNKKVRKAFAEMAINSRFPTLKQRF